MKHPVVFTIFLFLMTSWSNELTFKDQSFQKTTTLPCKENYPEITVKIPIAKNNLIVADSINKKVFSVLKQILYFGEKPYTSTDYTGLLASFIDSMRNCKKNFRMKPLVGKLKLKEV